MLKKNWIILLGSLLCLGVFLVYLVFHDSAPFLGKVVELGKIEQSHRPSVSSVKSISTNPKAPFINKSISIKTETNKVNHFDSEIRENKINTDKDFTDSVIENAPFVLRSAEVDVSTSDLHLFAGDTPDSLVGQIGYSNIRKGAQLAEKNLVKLKEQLEKNEPAEFLNPKASEDIDLQELLGESPGFLLNKDAFTESANEKIEATSQDSKHLRDILFANEPKYLTDTVVEINN
ncbi:MAG: hypothetical protein V3U84_08345 [Thiotrichaceae bacterium]